jgi:Rrf2 family protein
MKLSAKTEYACLAMLELAARFQSDEPVRVRDIADAHRIPSQFLVQILLQLKNAGLVASTRGAAGGYRLLSPPEDISLWDVVAVMEGPRETPSPSADSPFAAALAEAWSDIARVQQDALGTISFAELLERVKEGAEGMYYI